MTRERLKQYRALKREIARLDESIDKLRMQAADVPTVIGKVMASQREHPYIATHPLVRMDEPVAADAIAKRIRLREQRREECSKLLVEIEEFIKAIPDSTDRQIFELVFLEGMRQREVAERTGYSRSRIAQKISEILKD
ncbi:MAG: sigma factor-like helix-turn-helix DNA-binding protein [Lachnospiraceae bacterium]|nr:sigma factor-like helix-turn-helix DNA-binding protein [Lachnospiraceae bacterium]